MRTLNDFSSVKNIWEILDLLTRPNIFGEKEKRTPPPEVRPRDGHIEHVCKIQYFRVYLLKTAWRFGLWCGRVVICVVAFNYLVSA